MKSYLQSLMDDADITQQALAKELKMSPATIGKLQRNRFDRIDNETIEALCSYFKLDSINQLIEIEKDDVEKQPGQKVV
jgi:DNA-binding Xre family transcriptional regulator